MHARVLTTRSAAAAFANAIFTFVAATFPPCPLTATTTAATVTATVAATPKPLPNPLPNPLPPSVATISATPTIALQSASRIPLATVTKQPATSRASTASAAPASHDYKRFAEDVYWG